MAKIYVGNLPWSATEDELRELFAAHGDVQSVSIVQDRDTGRSRGFGFVEMDDEGSKKAIEALNGQEMDGRALRVDAAREKPGRH